MGVTLWAGAFSRPTYAQSFYMTSFDSREPTTTRAWGYAILMVLYLDALSVHDAVPATVVTIPADKNALWHAQYLRELLDLHVLSALLWSDTRGMLAYDLTKGSSDRTQLHQVVKGKAPASRGMNICQPGIQRPTPSSSSSHGSPPIFVYHDCPTCSRVRTSALPARQ